MDFNDAAVDVRSKDVRFSLQNSGGIRAPTWKYVWDEYAGRRVKLKPLGCEKDTSPHPTEPKPYPGKGDNKPPKDPGDHPPLNG